jgi:hypothetical protein
MLERNLPKLPSDVLGNIHGKTHRVGGFADGRREWAVILPETLLHYPRLAKSAAEPAGTFFRARREGRKLSSLSFLAREPEKLEVNIREGEELIVARADLCDAEGKTETLPPVR